MAKTIKSVEKAIKVLDCFFDIEEISINEIVEMTNLNKSTIYDLINTLEMSHLVRQNSENKKYRLGVKMLEFGRLYERQNPVSQVAQKYGETMAEKHHATVHLATYQDDQVIYLNKYESPQVMVSYSRVGKRAPMTCTGLGKAILAFLPEEYKEQHINHKELPRLTENSIVSMVELNKELEVIKKQGYAVDDEEIELGIRCVAAPLFSNGEVVGAMSISMLSPYATKERIHLLAQEIMEATASISNHI